MNVTPRPGQANHPAPPGCNPVSGVYVEPPYGFLSMQTNPSGFDCSESVRMNTTSVP